MYKTSKIVILTGSTVALLQLSAWASNPEIEDPRCSLKGTDTSTEAEGTREGTSSLVMVDAGKDRTAEIKVTLEEGEFCEGYPKWSGNGISSSDGSLTATYTGDTDSEISVEYGPGGGGGSFSLNLVTPTKQSLVIDLSDEGKIAVLVEKINTLLAKFKGGSKLETSGKLKFEWGETVDKYNDGSSLGTKVEATGSLNVQLPELDQDIDIPTTFGTIEIEIELADAGLTGSATGIYDESKESVGDIRGNITFGATIQGDIGPEWSLPGAEVDLEIGLASTVSATAEFTGENKALYWEPQVGVTKTEVYVSGRVQVWGAEWEVLSVTWPLDFLDDAKYSPGKSKLTDFN